MTDKLNFRRKIKRNTGPLAWKKILLILLILSISLITGAALAISAISGSLPDVTSIKNYTPNQASQIYDSKGRLLAKMFDEENRVVIPLKDIPKNVQHAVIAMEDERFYQHKGFDFKAILRSIVSVVDFSGHLVKGGGSTITQQLTRNVFLTQEPKINRKIAELVMARKIEKVLTKDEILELYLNEVYWGHNSYGVEGASRVFFGKSAKNLNLAEASLIGGLLSSPENYSPYKSFTLAKWRQSLTLANMVKNGYITQEEADQAKKEEITLTGLKRNYKLNSPYFTSYVIAQLKEKYDLNLLKTGGLKVYTTIDSNAQALAERTIMQEIATLKYRNITQGALVSIDPNTGYIKALVGGINYEVSNFNRITQAVRQPGSSFKPFIYLTAFKEKIINPYSPVVDEPVSYPAPGDDWNPKNYDGTFRGKMLVIDAVKHSINTIAIKTLDAAGISKVVDTARKLGITTPLKENLTLALGASEVTPLELASAFGVFATGGKKVRKIISILKITDSQGNILEDNSVNLLADQVYDSVSIDMLNECLKAVVSPGGSGAAAMLPDRVVAGKTGTTSNNKDSWFVGYIPQLVTLVWVGNDNNSVMSGATGGGICAPIWRKYMSVVSKYYPPKDFIKTGDWRETVGNKADDQKQKALEELKRTEEEKKATPTPEITVQTADPNQQQNPYVSSTPVEVPTEENPENNGEEKN